jgi:hypothetical protein
VRDSTLIVAFANAGAARRPTAARARELYGLQADATRAGELLPPFLARPVAPQELPAPCELQRAVIAIIDVQVPAPNRLEV